MGGGKKSDSLTEFIENLEEMDNRFEAHLYLNSFFTGYYLELDDKKRVWEPYTQMLREKGKVEERLNILEKEKTNVKIKVKIIY